MEYSAVYLSATFMILATIIFRKYAIGRVPYVVFDILWIAAIIRFLIPIKFESNLSIFNLYYVLENWIIRSMDFKIKGLEDIISFWYQHEAILKYVVFGIWFVGFVILSKFFYSDYRKGIQIINNAEVCAYDTEIKNWLKEKNFFRNIEIKISYDITNPVSYGILKQGILLPPDFLWQKEHSRQILLHESIHIKYFHEVYGIVLTLLLCINWFHPCVWLLYKYAHRDMEIFCDRHVLMLLGEKEKKSYALNLIQSAELEGEYFVVYSSFTKSSIKERIEAIMNFKKLSVFAIIVSIIISTSVVTIFATSDAVITGKELSEGIRITQQEGVDMVTMVKSESICMKGSLEDIEPYVKEMNTSYYVTDYEYVIYKKHPPSEIVYSLEENELVYEGKLVCTFVKCDSKKEKYIGYYSGVLY